jgi:cystathionine gamma-synthase
VSVEQWSARTRLITAGRPSAAGHSLNTPIVGVSAYAHGGDRIYARADGTPTWDALEEVIGSVEGGTAVAFASGMAAIAAVLDTVPPQARIAAPLGCYHGTLELLRSGDRVGRWTTTWLPPTDTDAWRAAAADHDLLWLESPTNPLLQIMDLPAILRGVSPQCRAVVDNTFATPLGQTPLRLGADVVVHSATKYLNGHSDALAGVVVTPRPDVAAALRSARTLRGGTPGMLEAYLALRGMRTLALRMTAASANAGNLAARLAGHPAVRRVHYPGLPSDPGHELAASFMTGYGAVVSFEVVGGAPTADRVCATSQLIRHATSLGGVESTMERRASVPGQEHLPEGLIRLSVGIEDPADLWRDLAQSLEQ